MRQTAPLIAICILAAACGEQRRTVAAPDFTLAVVADAGHSGEGEDHFNPKLLGKNENPPRLTPAHGRAVFHVSDDGQSVDYMLVVNDITNVRQSHIAPANTGPGDFPGGEIRGQLMDKHEE